MRQDDRVSSISGLSNDIALALVSFIKSQGIELLKEKVKVKEEKKCKG